jgi:hypothetical protein
MKTLNNQRFGPTWWGDVKEMAKSYMCKKCHGIPMSSQAEQLTVAIAKLQRQIEKTDAKAIRMHGGRKCGKHFWCGGYCERVRELLELKKKQEQRLDQAMAFMAAERLAAAGLNSDVLRMIVDMRTHG